MNKKITLYTLSLLLLAFGGCKKQSDILDKNSIHATVFPPELKDSTSGSYRYLLKGCIVAPSKVDMRDYGFSVANPSIPLQSLGSANKAGYVEKEVTSSTQLTESMILFYIITTQGDTILSDTSGSVSSASPNFSFQGESITSVVGTDIYLTSNFTYNTASGYAVSNYVLLYELTTASSYTSYPLFSLLNPNTPGNYGISGVALSSYLGLIKGTSYNFQVQVTLMNAGGNTLTYSSPMTTQSF
jgi:hypothetical protein